MGNAGSGWQEEYWFPDTQCSEQVVFEIPCFSVGFVGVHITSTTVNTTRLNRSGDFRTPRYAVEFSAEKREEKHGLCNTTISALGICDEIPDKAIRLFLTHRVTKSCHIITSFCTECKSTICGMPARISIVQLKIAT